MENNSSDTLVQCRVNSQTYSRLMEIVETYGFKSVYEVMQYVVTAFIRTVDVAVGLADEDENVREYARMFEGFENAGSRLINTKEIHSRRYTLTEAVMIFAERGKKPSISKTIEQDADGMVVSVGKDKPLDVVLMRLYPRLHAALTEIGGQMGETRTGRIISELASAYQHKMPRNAGAEIAEEFDSLDGSIEYGNVPKQMRTRRADNG